MALLNQLLSDKDLAALSPADRDFLVQRIDYALLNSPEVRKVVGSQLKSTLSNLGKKGVTLQADKVLNG